MFIKAYSELSQLKTFEERFEYLRNISSIGDSTFGFDRYLNQNFYRSSEWRRLRDLIIIRDNGCDLGVDGYEINDKIIIHHMIPITQDDIINRTDYLLNPEFLITTRPSTHSAIHYGDQSLLLKNPIERSKNDTCPWRHN